MDPTSHKHVLVGRRSLEAPKITPSRLHVVPPGIREIVGDGGNWKRMEGLGFRRRREGLLDKQGAVEQGWMELERGDTSVLPAAANFGEVGGPGLVKSTYTTSTWCPLGPLAASAAKGANGVCGVLGAPGAGVGVVVERATPMSSSDDREGRMVSPQATGSLFATGERVGCSTNTNLNMDYTTKESLVTAPGDLGAPGAGAGVVVKQATPVSLSDDCGARLVDHQASGALMVIGE
ncbi:hypothetical protein WN55_06877 [Dufourea novaeangliae]|uniref:Uncharacterized protein n=1 Tax=Dufourea novaeangliae TaxID=178035 RepID=A0A154PT72_DUFNO|nr:hypothetical protein WN55_06877 [Dufourea novaeangliae]